MWSIYPLSAPTGALVDNLKINIFLVVASYSFLPTTKGFAENPWARHQPSWRPDHPRFLLWQRRRQAGIQGGKIEHIHVCFLYDPLSSRTLSASCPSSVQWARRAGKTWRTPRRTNSCSHSGCMTSMAMGQSVWWVLIGSIHIGDKRMDIWIESKMRSTWELNQDNCLRTSSWPCWPWWWTTSRKPSFARSRRSLCRRLTTLRSHGARSPCIFVEIYQWWKGSSKF